MRMCTVIPTKKGFVGLDLTVNLSTGYAVCGIGAEVDSAMKPGSYLMEGQSAIWNPEISKFQATDPYAVCRTSNMNGVSISSAWGRASIEFREWYKLRLSPEAHLYSEWSRQSLRYDAYWVALCATMKEPYGPREEDPVAIIESTSAWASLNESKRVSSLVKEISQEAR